MNMSNSESRKRETAAHPTPDLRGELAALADQHAAHHFGYYGGCTLCRTQDAYAYLRALLARHAADEPVEPRRLRCTQCGKGYEERACGPTHALIAAERGVADESVACVHDWRPQKTVGPAYDECARCEQRRDVDEPVAADEGEQDWEPLSEDVSSHSMVYTHDHGDRSCSFHQRLNSWTFGWPRDKRCLRDDHPEHAGLRDPANASVEVPSPAPAEGADEVDAEEVARMVLCRSCGSDPNVDCGCRGGW